MASFDLNNNFGSKFTGGLYENSVFGKNSTKDVGGPPDPEESYYSIMIFYIVSLTLGILILVGVVVLILFFCTRNMDPDD